MTRCYEAYCFLLNNPDACPKDDRLWRYIQAYTRFLRTEKGVQFDRSDEDKERFRVAREECGTERVALKVRNNCSVSLPNKKYQTLVIDPPWPVEKILRLARPRQEKEFDYQVMTIGEILGLPIKDIANEDAHFYLWTTHKFLPTALEVFKSWGVNYQCLLTWIKSVGITPFTWMYSTEHILFGRIGSLSLLKNGERLDFTGKVRQHSRKPDEFYELVKRVSPEPRLDMFAREQHEGFEVWGNETDKFHPC